MKNIYKNLTGLCMLVFLISSCDDEDFTGASNVVPTSPTISITSPGDVPAFVEQDTSFAVVITMSEPQVVDVAVHLTQIGGDMSNGTDFSMPGRVIIPKGETSISTTIDFLFDEEAEQTETLEVQIGDDRTANASITPTTSSFTVLPIKSTSVDFTLSWEFADFEYNGEDICDLIGDLDLTIQNPGDVNMYDTDLLGYQMASLSCPESGTLDVTTMVAGEVYEVWVAIYSGFDAGEAGPQAINVTIDFARGNSEFHGSVVISDVFMSDMAAAGGIFYTLELSGDTLTLVDSDGNTVGEGRVDYETQLKPVSKP